MSEHGPQPAELHAALLEAAREYLRRGWSVVPLTIAKTPPAGFNLKRAQTTLPTEADVRESFGPDKRGVVGLGVVCGAVSGGLAVRDFDDPAVYAAWAAAHPDLAAMLPTVRTARGFHVYLRWPGQKTLTVAGGEMRGELVYVAAPPSIHESGAVYEWLVPLPEGPLPLVDPGSAGLLGCATERTQKTERTKRTKSTQKTEPWRGTPPPMALSSASSPSSRASLSSGDSPSSLSHGTDALPLPAEELEPLIVRTLPRGRGVRNNQVFALARALKGRPELRDLRAVALRPVVREWHRRAYPVMGTKPWETTWGDFIHGWERVRHAAGDSPTEVMMREAQNMRPPAVALEYEDSAMRHLITICRELQKGSGSGPFFLSGHKAAEVIGRDHATVYRWLGVLMADGVLELVEKGGGPKRPNKATRYYYRGGE